MPLHPVVLTPDLLAAPGSVLRRPCEPVDLAGSPGELLRALVTEMLALQHRLEGIGIAAPQVGLSLRIAIVDDRERPPILLVNPRVVRRSAETERGPEGCLSLPGFVADVERAREVTVEAQGADGERFEITAEGSLARTLQHEIDHLDGVLYVDHLASPSELRAVDAETLAARSARYLFEPASRAELTASWPIRSCTSRGAARG